MLLKVRMKTINPSEKTVKEIYNYLTQAIGPRPIALASTVDLKGNPNVSPYSFFNIFSINPPILVFSASRKVRDNTTKHTLQNVLETNEVVINVVNYAMVQQVSLSSAEYPKGINEFKKAGFTMLPSEEVKPYRVAESPVQLECKVNRVIELGKEGGSGSLIVCEVIKIHINNEVLDEKNQIDPHKIDLVSRLGGSWYSRTINGLFEVERPNSLLGIGVDSLPEAVRNSKVLTGNDLGVLANVANLPSKEEVVAFKKSSKSLITFMENADETTIHKKAKEYIEINNIQLAWSILLAKDY